MGTFKFHFDLEEDTDKRDDHQEISGETLEKQAEEEPFAELDLPSLLDRLPSQISCSPLYIPLSSGQRLALARRDLFDARFQLMSEGVDESGELQKQTALKFLNDPSDLVPSVYEGGLKTWECSLDLVDYLNKSKPVLSNSSFAGNRFLEVGCGTGVPSLYVLREIFSSTLANGPAKETHIHLQDYNASVLELVTLPNIFLTWYMSPAGSPHRAPEVNSERPTEVEINPALIASFRDALQAYSIHLRLFSGSWGSFDLSLSGRKYNFVITSETVYRTSSIPSLVKLMYGACGYPLRSAEDSRNASPYVCLLAAKNVYFGVGGGVEELMRTIEDSTSESAGSEGKVIGAVEMVWERKTGIARKILRISWI